MGNGLRFSHILSLFPFCLVCFHPSIFCLICTPSCVSYLGSCTGLGGFFHLFYSLGAFSFCHIIFHLFSEEICFNNCFSQFTFIILKVHHQLCGLPLNVNFFSSSVSIPLTYLGGTCSWHLTLTPSPQRLSVPRRCGTSGLGSQSALPCVSHSSSSPPPTMAAV